MSEQSHSKSGKGEHSTEVGPVSFHCRSNLNTVAIVATPCVAAWEAWNERY